MTSQAVLKQHFGYSSFRPGQLEIVESILSNQDTLAILPTGGGKSICFQVPGIMLAGITLVISPLISLMKDQVDTLVQKGIKATYLNSSLSQQELQKRSADCASGCYKFIYIAPERLQTTHFIQVCQNLNISLIAVDEAHCVSMWGHDFRPEYFQISQFVMKLNQRPTLAAFTATATPKVKQEIISSLQLNSPKVFQKSFLRSNLKFGVQLCQSNSDQELALFYLLKKHHGQSGIIYTLTRDSTQHISHLINHFWPQTKSEYYHGGMDSEDRSQVQDRFIKDRTRLIAATNAFGMGVDKPNVRFVIHYHTSSTLENYYQEAGRAGRDGQPANCYLLFNKANLQLNLSFINQSHPDENSPRRKIELAKLNSILNYATSKKCRNQIVLEYFGEKRSQGCHNCDNCVEESTAKSSGNDLYLSRLTQLRTQLAQEAKLHPHQVMTDQVARWLALIQPQSENEYLKIPGVGWGWVEKWHQIVSKRLKDNWPPSPNQPE